jgi:lysophospholipase L1-like esterase
MPRKIQSSFPKGRSKTICAIGDSLTWNAIYGTLMCDFYPEQLAELLRAPSIGCDVKARNFGNSGERTSQMLQRIRCMTQFETPEVAIIFGGANDPGGGVTANSLTNVGTTATFTASGSHNLATGDVVTITGSNLSPYNVANAVVTVTSATVFTYVMASDPGGSSAGTPRFDHQTQANIEAMIIALKNGCAGMVGTQTALPAGYPPGTRFIVRYDTSTTGGLSGTSPATLSGTHSGAQVWVSRNRTAGVTGWSRITPDNTGIQRIIVMSMQWVHRANGLGDTLAVPYSAYVPVRAAQSAAASAQGVTFFDLYTYQRNLIVSGYVGELTGEWAATTNDQHPSAFAGWTWAKGLLEHIQDQDDWIEALTQ